MSEADAFEPIPAQRIAIVDMAVLRRRRPPDGAHMWVIGAVYAVTDPTVPLDQVPIEMDHLIGYQGVHCLWCLARVEPSMVGERCDG